MNETEFFDALKSIVNTYCKENAKTIGVYVDMDNGGVYHYSSNTDGFTLEGYGKLSFIAQISLVKKK